MVAEGGKVLPIREATWRPVREWMRALQGQEESFLESQSGRIDRGQK